MESGISVTYSNKYNIPTPIVNAVEGFDKGYQDGRGDTDLSVTQLIGPPLIPKLVAEHKDEIQEDVSDKIWALFGSAVHGILENSVGDSPNIEVERRMFLEVNGLKVSGQADLIEGTTLSDYKVTSVWSVIGKHKPEWERQLNLLAYLARNDGIKIDKLQIVTLLRDWSKGRANSADYPECNIKVIDIPLWTEDEQRAYLESRVALHTADNVEPCTMEERWAKPTRYACMKKGRKSAVKLFDLESECLNYIKEKGGGHYLEVRPGEHTRCEGYCQVSEFCPYKEND